MVKNTERLQRMGRNTLCGPIDGITIEAAGGNKGIPVIVAGFPFSSELDIFSFSMLFHQRAFLTSFPDYRKFDSPVLRPPLFGTVVSCWPCVRIPHSDNLFGLETHLKQHGNTGCRPFLGE